MDECYRVECRILIPTNARIQSWGCDRLDSLCVSLTSALVTAARHSTRIVIFSEGRIVDWFFATANLSLFENVSPNCVIGKNQLA